RKQTSSSVQNGIQAAQGVPGALYNEPPPNALAPIEAPAAAQAPGQAAGQNPAAPAPAAPAGALATGGQADALPTSSRSDATVNYEVDRTISHVRHALGSLQRLSVAVVVNYRDVDGEAQPLDPADLTKIDELVRQAMGFSAERGDTLSVVNTAFTDTTPRIPVWENPMYQAYVLQALKVLFFLAVIAFLWRSVLRPIIQGYANAQVERAKVDARQQAAREQQRMA